MKYHKEGDSEEKHSLNNNFGKKMGFAAATAESDTKQSGESHDT